MLIPLGNLPTRPDLRIELLKSFGCLASFKLGVRQNAALKHVAPMTATAAHFVSVPFIAKTIGKDVRNGCAHHGEKKPCFCRSILYPQCALVFDFPKNRNGPASVRTSGS